MLKKSTTYRSVLAYTLSALMIFIITSGVVFMHKEVKSTGEIVTHIHPYDFTKKGKAHHKSDAEIEFLNVVFSGTFTSPSITLYDLELSPIILSAKHPQLIEGFTPKVTPSELLRGPPSIA